MCSASYILHTQNSVRQSRTAQLTQLGIVLLNGVQICVHEELTDIGGHCRLDGKRLVVPRCRFETDSTWRNCKTLLSAQLVRLCACMLCTLKTLENVVLATSPSRHETQFQMACTLLLEAHNGITDRLSKPTSSSLPKLHNIWASMVQDFFSFVDEVSFVAEVCAEYDFPSFRSS